MSEKNSQLVIIAETAFNHEGCINYLFTLIDTIADSGVTHIKFQVLIDYAEFVSSSSKSCEVIKSWCFTEAEWELIFMKAELKGLKLFLMPLDIKAVALCKRKSVDFVEIHSVSFNDYLLHQQVKEQIGTKKIVFGLGGRTFDEIQSLKNYYLEDSIVLMHGFQAFPSKLDEVKLARLKYLAELFPNSILGYADHSAPDTNDAVFSSIYAYHLGARIFEKHVTLDLERTDSQSALTAEQLNNYVYEMHRFEKIINEDKESAFSFSNNESNYRSRQKQVVATKKIIKGDVFTENNISLKMHTTKGDYTLLKDVISTKAAHDFDVDEVIINREHNNG